MISYEMYCRLRHLLDKARFLFLRICILFIVSGLLKKSISRLWLQLGFQQIQDPLLIGFRNGDLMEFGSREMDLLSTNGLQAFDHVFKGPLPMLANAVRREKRLESLVHMPLQIVRQHA